MDLGINETRHQTLVSRSSNKEHQHVSQYPVEIRYITFNLKWCPPKLRVNLNNYFCPVEVKLKDRKGHNTARAITLSPRWPRHHWQRSEQNAICDQRIGSIPRSLSGTGQNVSSSVVTVVVVPVSLAESRKFVPSELSLLVLDLGENKPHLRLLWGFFGDESTGLDASRGSCFSESSEGVPMAVSGDGSRMPWCVVSWKISTEVKEQEGAPNGQGLPYGGGRY